MDSPAAPATKPDLKTLLAIAATLSATLDIDGLLDLTMDMICRVLRAGASSLLLIDRETDTLYFRTASGEKREEIKRVRLKIGQGIAGWVAREGKSFLTNDVTGEPRFARDISQAIDYSTRSILAVPLVWESHTMGVMEVLNSLDGGFTEADREALEVLAAHVTSSLMNARAYSEATTERDQLKEKLEGRLTAVGVSPAFQAVVRTARKVARANATILLRGASGTGKEVIAHLIHRESPRGDRPMVTINCAAITDTLLESELFGHERGAFTGADRTKKGRFEQAHGGTLFLDEIGCMGVELQAKLLRAIQNREIDRVGGVTSIPVDVRIIAATNSNLDQMVRDGKFREDLFWRLNVIALTLPPLRERREDIPALIEHFIRRYNRELGKDIRGISPAALDILMAYAYPGNIRELENIIERAVVLEDEVTIQPERLPFGPRPSTTAGPNPPAGSSAPTAGGAAGSGADIQSSPGMPSPDGAVKVIAGPGTGSGQRPGGTVMPGGAMTLDALEEAHIREIYIQCGYSKAQSCKVLGISRPTLDRKLQRYAIQTPHREGQY